MATSVFGRNEPHGIRTEFRVPPSAMKLRRPREKQIPSLRPGLAGATQRQHREERFSDASDRPSPTPLGQAAHLCWAPTTCHSLYQQHSSEGDEKIPALAERTF